MEAKRTFTTPPDPTNIPAYRLYCGEIHDRVKAALSRRVILPKDKEFPKYPKNFHHTHSNPFSASFEGLFNGKSAY
ncbi:MAG: hypothetical protein GY793_02560 [Proteobacteria bacterium]|nr:hypothetical protein [Pseudomonadota bacterium]